MAECQRDKRCYWVSQSHKLQVGLSPPQPHLIHLFDFSVFSSFPTKPSATFILPVFKMNTWQQISPKYIQAGHPKLCCSPDISFTCPFNKGSDAYRSALHLSSARRHSFPFLRSWIFFLCKHRSTSVLQCKHQSTTSQKPFWLRVAKCTIEKSAQSQEYP